MLNHSIGPRPRRHHQSVKPYSDFPLTAQPSGRWCKKARGKIIFFGKLDNPQVALEKWLAEKDELLAGRNPRANCEGLTQRDLANRFLSYKRQRVDSRELSERTFVDYHVTCERLVNTFGKERLAVDLAAHDFERLRADIAKQWGPPHRVGVRSHVMGIDMARSAEQICEDNRLVRGARIDRTLRLDAKGIRERKAANTETAVPKVVTA